MRVRKRGFIGTAQKSIQERVVFSNMRTPHVIPIFDEQNRGGMHRV